MMKLTKFIKELPGVRERMAGRDIKAGLILSPAAMDDLYVMHGHHGPVTLIGPDAGAELRDLYQAAKLPMKPYSSIDKTPLVYKYLANRADFEEEIRLRRAIRDKAKRPDDLSPEDLSNWHILEHIFRDAVGGGEGSIKIAGRLVTKVHSGRRGKATGADYTFQWGNDQGEAQIVEFELLQPTQRGYGESKAA